MISPEEAAATGRQAWMMQGPPRVVDLLDEDGRRQRAWEWPIVNPNGVRGRIWVVGFSTSETPPVNWRVVEPEDAS